MESAQKHLRAQKHEREKYAEEVSRYQLKNCACTARRITCRDCHILMRENYE